MKASFQILSNSSSYYSTLRRLGADCIAEQARTNLTSFSIILQRVEPLLGNDSVNTFPRRDTKATMVQQQSSGVFYVVSAEMLYNRKGLGQLVR
jgi:hypothetical protein